MENQSEAFDRRQFGARLATVAAAPASVLFGAAEASAAEQKPEPPAPPSEVDLYWELVRRHYPDARLDEPANREEIRDELETQLARSKTLSRFPLTNADEPGFAFGAYRRE
jgi:hypothetical protein